MPTRRSQLIITGLLALFAFLTWQAIDSKCPTVDEPLHVASSLTIKQLSDYRMDPEDPALFKHWLSLTQSERVLPKNRFWETASKIGWSQWVWSTFTLYGPNGDDVDSIFRHARAMMLITSVLLGVVIAAWAWKIAGPWSAVAATAVFALDPNFLGHSAIAKNDVIATLGFVAVAFAVWLVGLRVTTGRVLFLLAATAFTFCVKFSGVLLVPILALILLMRIMSPVPWPNPWGEWRTRPQRAIAAMALLVMCGLFTMASIWAAYGFRYAPSPDPTFTFDLAKHTVHAGYLQLVDRFHLLPSAYTFGLGYTIESASRGAFLLGKHSTTGFLLYFPIAMAVKTPLATLAAVLFSTVIACTPAGRARFARHRWTLFCLLIPAYVYALAALRSNLNIGVRHMLPVYPFAFIAAAAVLSRYRKVAVALAIVLAIESFAAFPNYIAYFNAAAGGSRGGFRILSDSNLDWGQDLKLLSAWQSQHPDTRLYLSYFGTADPGAYGIHYINCAAGYAYDQTTYLPDKPGVIAVSATHLQGVYISDSTIDFYASLRAAQPREVLGGTIYLFDWPLKGN